MSSTQKVSRVFFSFLLIACLHHCHHTRSLLLVLPQTNIWSAVIPHPWFRVPISFHNNKVALHSHQHAPQWSVSKGNRYTTNIAPILIGSGICGLHYESYCNTSSSVLDTTHAIDSSTTNTKVSIKILS